MLRRWGSEIQRSVLSVFLLYYACPAKLFRGHYRICTKKGPTHRFAELSLWRRPNSIWHHCPFPEKGGSLHKFYQAWLPVVPGTQAINSMCVNWQAILLPFRRTCSGTPRQSGSQISAPLSFKTSVILCSVIFSLLCNTFNRIYIIIYFIVFVLYCLLLLSMTFLVIQPLGCERDQ